MSEYQALTSAVAARYQQAGKADKRRILDELCADTGWHRDHARKALRGARRPTVVGSRRQASPKYGREVIAALVSCWSVLGMPAGKRLAPMLGELVPVLRRFGELDIDDDTAQLLVGMSAATIDRRLAPERRRYEFQACRYPQSGVSLKARPPVCNWCGIGRDGAVPGFVEVGLAPHDCQRTGAVHSWTLTVVDIATGWTEKRSLSSTAEGCVLAALDDIAINMPFPIMSVTSNDGSGSVDGWSGDRKNRAIVHTLSDYHRDPTTADVLLLNKIWKLQALLTNYFYPQQKLASKTRAGTRVLRRHDTAITPYRRIEAHPAVSTEDKAILADTYATINPAAVQRQIQALTAELIAMTDGQAPRAC